MTAVELVTDRTYVPGMDEIERLRAENHQLRQALAAIAAAAQAAGDASAGAGQRAVTDTPSSAAN